MVTVIEGAPAGPTPAPPTTPRREPRSWLRSGFISCGWGSPVSEWLDELVVFAVGGGVGPEVEKEKEEEDEEVWEEVEEDVEVEEVEEVEVDVKDG